MWCSSKVPAMPRSMRTAASSSGSSTCTTWKRRVSAASFSMCFLYSDQVVAAIVRKVPRASAGLSRFAASPVPGGPAGADQGVRLVDEQDDAAGCEDLHLLDHRLQAVLELAPDGGAGLHGGQVEREEPHVAQGRRHVARGDAQRQALDKRGLADAGLADDDRVVLPAPHQDVDDLADLAVAAQHRVDAARPWPAR